MKEYLYIIQKGLPSVTEADLYLPINETNIDSLDIVVIRVALEKHFNHVITDPVWYQFQSLSEAIHYFHNSKSDEITSAASKDIELTDIVEVRMPQMANSALSENWLMKYLGDVHWLLLSKGLVQSSSQFKDDLGNRLYATFVRINYSLSSLKKFNENNIINFKGEINRFGNETYLSKILGDSNSNNIDATLMTIFSIRENGGNNEMVKTKPVQCVNHIPEISHTPPFLDDYRLLKKSLLEEYACAFGTFDLSERSIFSCEYDLNPFYDINGVGLLYFASYVAIADKCILNYFKQENNSINFCDDYHTVYRDIFYFANCNCNDTISFTLNNLVIEEKLVKYVCSLSRKSDNKALAKVIAVKEKTGA
ncbi:Pnap_2097 family protein [Flavisolibacter tropicus]|uniref:Carrier domain-containing protein n=1 Tax=Flavisolibacter tropicus TaxID=1492898 RepID=A0A172TV27_9BACT|nr:Pnap_2097 family protein [Flavisolibacter tropicus]ANE50633.1 hypothetical protein SY85_09090 [Flavisolibacter tropicus]